MVSIFQFDIVLEELPVDTEKLYLAFSGGIDSTVLMHVLASYKERYQIVLWHINHGLQVNAKSMEEFARSQAKQFGITFRLDSLSMNLSDRNLEAKAREFRYRLFEQALSNKDVLITAHHKNDQAETLLLNMMRGSGSTGLRAIARLKNLGNGLLFRPLLNVTRHEIEQYAKDHQLEWVEDPSNQNRKYDRNYLRKEVLPAIVKRWPSAISQLQRVSELQNENEQLLTDLAQIDYAEAKASRPLTDFTCLSINRLNKLSPARIKNVIRFWIKSNGFAVIGFHKIEELLKQLNSRVDASPVTEGCGFKIRVYRSFLYLVKNSGTFLLEEIYEMPISGNLNISRLNFSQSRLDLYSFLKRVDNGEKAFLFFRQVIKGGKTSPHAHAMKRLFQKHQVPPWKRSSIPLIILDGELIALWLEKN